MLLVHYPAAFVYLLPPQKLAHRWQHRDPFSRDYSVVSRFSLPTFCGKIALGFSLFTAEGWGVCREEKGLDSPLWKN